MTHLDAPETASTTTESAPEPPTIEPRRPGAGVLLLAVVFVVAVVLVLLTLAGGDDGPDGQIAEVMAQGGGGPALGDATLIRRPDGVFAEIDARAPEPNTYEYPTADMVPPWSEPHPPVSPGASDAPEVFTVWLIAFNEPSQCTDGICDSDDVPAGAVARASVYQIDGRIVTDGRFAFAGGVRLGQTPMAGVPLEDPMSAEIHLAIAPHGRALDGPDGWRQLNGPVGNPTLWWSAEFPADQA